MKLENHIKRKISIGYIKPSKKEFEFLRKAEGLWTVKTIHLGLYGEEVESRPYTTFAELKERVRHLRSSDFVFRYV